ncbi:DUF7716 domain-containing protein [Serratia aquatilis]|uniref:DUF7716 domain-containing protein n=1 Tax=Serratia aquatilis TaxID=1737515 RepID=UPI00406BB0D2
MNIVKIDECKNNNLCIYTKEHITHASPTLTCYLDYYPVVNDEDEEVFPDFSNTNELELFYYGEHFFDVITNILSQKKDATINDSVNGLNYYMGNYLFIKIL